MVPPPPPPKLIQDEDVSVRYRQRSTAPDQARIGAVAEPAGVLYASIYNNGTKAEQNPDRKFTFVANPDSFAGQISAMTYLKQIHSRGKNHRLRLNRLMAKSRTTRLR